MFAHYTRAMIQWAQGELDDDEFRAATQLGMSLMLLGLARGRAVRDLERRAQELQPKSDETRIDDRRQPRRRRR